MTALLCCRQKHFKTISSAWPILSSSKFLVLLQREVYQHKSPTVMQGEVYRLTRTYRGANRVRFGRATRTCPSDRVTAHIKESNWTSEIRFALNLK